MNLIKISLKNIFPLKIKMCVRKTFNSEGETSYNGYLFSPKADFLKEENISTVSKREELDKTDLKDLVSSSDRLTKDIIKAAQEECTFQLLFLTSTK